MNMDEVKRIIQEAFDKESGTRRFILTCSCAHQDKKALEAFATLFPTTPTPPIYKGRDRIYKLAQETKSAHIKAISKLSNKFSYYLVLEGDAIIEEWNLMNGKRIA